MFCDKGFTKTLYLGEEQADMYRAILFDLDGTLTASAEGITKSVQYALQKLGIEEPDLEKLEAFVGPPLLDQFMEAYGMDLETARQAVV